MARPPQPPAELDAVGKATWRVARAELLTVGSWTDATAELLRLYVVALQTGRQARSRIAARLDADGEHAAYFTKGSMGQLVAHPDVAIARQAEQDAATYGRELLISPASRRRARIEGQLDDGDLLDRALHLVSSPERTSAA